MSMKMKMDRKKTVRRSKFRSLLFLSGLLAGSGSWAQANPPAEDKPASVAGIVTNSVTGEPLAHAHITLEGRPMKGSDRYGAVSAADGRFSITTILPGTYTLVVKRGGYGPLLDEEDKARLIELKLDDRVEDLVLRLVPNAVISGRVVDANGIPREQVEVQAVSAGPIQSAETDDRGEFRIGGLRAGRYFVKALSDLSTLPPEVRTDGTVEINYGPTYYPVSLTTKSATPVLVRAGEETGGIEIKLAAAPILHVSGTVPSVPDGGPRPSLTLYNGQMQSLYFAAPEMKFTIWRLPPGRYQLYLEDDDRGSSVHGAPAEINLTSSSIEGIQLDGGRPIELKGRVQVEGDVPIAGHAGVTPSIELQPLGGIPNADRDEDINPDGSFKMTDVSPGRYHVAVEDAPPDLYVKSVHLGTTEFQDGILNLYGGVTKALLTVQLGTDGAQISGVVRDLKGQSGGVQVDLLFEDEYGVDVAGTASAGLEGRYAFHGIAPGKYKLVAYDSKYSNGTWSSDALALYESVTEEAEVGEGDKISQDLKLLTSQ